MTTLISPRVAVIERDLSLMIPAVATSIGVTVLRNTYKGPELKKQLITNEDELINTFGAPSDIASCYEDVLSANGFLKYGNTLYCTRVLPDDATFAGITSTTATSGVSASFSQLPSSGDSALTLDDFASKDPDDFADEINPAGIMDFIAMSRGTHGDNLRIAIVSSQSYDEIFRKNQHTDWDITNTVLSTDSVLDADDDKEFLVYVQRLPEGKDATDPNNWDNVETWNVSTDTTALDDNGRSKFAEVVINEQSEYIRITLSETLQKNKPMNTTTVEFQQFGGGYLGDSSTNLNSQIMEALDLYDNAEEIDVNIFIDSNKSETIKSYINDICISRADSVGVLDVPYNLVVNNRGNETTDLVAWRRGNAPYETENLNINSSYVSVYANWIEVYDKWNQRYRWIPASGHVAGLYANNDEVGEAWFAPAGLNRALLTSVRRLAFNPNLGKRDILYKNGLNPIVSFSGQGKVLWGQKTLLDKASAFNRINVRRLFITLEKAIATSARYMLFEPNDVRTRLQIIDMIEPFLRDVKSRRGIYDFLVVCDERNNTPERIDRNELWVDVYIKPVRAAEYIVLRFTATKTGASFEELAAADAGQ